MVAIGVDLGGTNIKTAVVDESYNILAEKSRPTCIPRTGEAVTDDIILCMREAMAEAGVTDSEVIGVGIGCPGTIDGEEGMVRYSNNLYWKDFPMREYFRSQTGFAPAMGNDANVAALGEVAAGSAKGTSDAVIVTLGTGVGSGVVLNGEILTGYGGGAAEIGHTVIVDGGAKCTCGRRGCFEAYSSATGLIRMTEQAIEKAPESRMAALAKQAGRVSGRTAFDAMREGDEAGRAVVEQYIHYLACGITNVVNTFQPEVVAFSGGISKEGETLLAPLRVLVEEEMFGGPTLRMTRFEVCTLGHRAGIIGAAELARQALAAKG